MLRHTALALYRGRLRCQVLPSFIIISRNLSHWQPLRGHDGAQTVDTIFHDSDDLSRLHGERTIDGSRRTAPAKRPKGLWMTTLLNEAPSPSELLEDFLRGQQGREYELLKEEVAAMRTQRLPILLMQMWMRQDLQQQSNEMLKNLLPNGRVWRYLISLVLHKGYTMEELDYCLYVLRGKDDNERCERFLQYGKSLPIFILNLLLSSKSKLSDPALLSGLLDYCGTYYDGKKSWMTGEIKPIPGGPRGSCGRSHMNMLNMSDRNFSQLIDRCAEHCFRIEPRLIVKVADVAAQYIRNMGASDGAGGIWQQQCLLINAIMEKLTPHGHIGALPVQSPHEYLWEAQKKLLTLSSSLEKTLLLDNRGFRAVRRVLAGMPKNSAEVVTASLQAPHWPPYIQASHGMDEMREIEEGWSRTVTVGTIMQEAGYHKLATDEPLDILTGTTPDGTPTIQQRISVGRSRSISQCEAAIRATRNAREAWGVFRHASATPGAVGSAEYAAMLEKLVMKSAAFQTRDLQPGDKSLNFDTENEANLSELERARLEPPSVAELYRRMKQEGITPNRQCLQILVENADSLDAADEYLQESAELTSDPVVLCLQSESPDPAVLRDVPIKLLKAYIGLCFSTGRVSTEATRRRWKRVFRLISRRMETADTRLHPVLLHPLLKELSQHYNGLAVTQREQLAMWCWAARQLEQKNQVQLSQFIQLCKTMRKMSQRAIDDSFKDANLEESLLPKSEFRRNMRNLHSLYNRVSGNAPSSQHILDMADLSWMFADEFSWRRQDVAWPSFGDAADILARMCKKLISQEKATQKLLTQHEIGSERMKCRRDPVLPEHGREYMLALAVLGEFEEMASFLRWNLGEWNKPDLKETLESWSSSEADCDIGELLCIFRIFAEPHVEPATTQGLQAVTARLGLSWPDELYVEQHAQLYNERFTVRVSRLFSSRRAYQERNAHREGGRPSHQRRQG
ncbi:hypothetical protein B0I35DRAFT_173816 [Stachybotrys elegans]|uniref:Uncharacterized protein n=1 Tax=Stachybotrys elegans TaxID=80388 RepID=A0A8K0WVF9_9HYPO|nr:hypothetical protein B0I35DRAFT_173816 [Stachybotrys elegans]